jgi:hypothetical protein
VGWWNTAQERDIVLSVTMDPNHQRESVGTAAMALHGIGKSALEVLVTQTPELDDLVPYLSQVDISDVIVPLSRAIGDRSFDLVTSWHYDAAQAARFATKTLVAKNVPEPLAVQRAAAIYGATSGYLGRFLASMTVPAVHPLVLSDIGERAVSQWAEQAAFTVASTIAKEDVVRYGQTERVTRDKDGQFVTTKRVGGRMVAVRADAHQMKAVQEQQEQREEDASVSDEAQAQAERVKRFKYLTQKAQKRQHLARVERVKRVQRAQEIKLEQERAASVSRHGTSRVQGVQDKGVQLSSEKALKVKEIRDFKARVDRIRTTKKRVLTVRARRKLLDEARENIYQTHGGSSEVNWDPPAMTVNEIRSVTVGSDGYTQPKQSFTQYIQVPVPAILHAYSGSGDAPRLSIKALNEYLSNNDLPPTILIDDHTLPRPFAVGGAFKNEIGPVVNVPIDAAIVNRFNEVAPYISVPLDKGNMYEHGDPYRSAVVLTSYLSSPSSRDESNQRIEDPLDLNSWSRAPHMDHLVQEMSTLKEDDYSQLTKIYTTVASRQEERQDEVQHVYMSQAGISDDDAELHVALQHYEDDSNEVDDSVHVQNLPNAIQYEATPDEQREYEWHMKRAGNIAALTKLVSEENGDRIVVRSSKILMPLTELTQADDVLGYAVGGPPWSSPGNKPDEPIESLLAGFVDDENMPSIDLDEQNHEY